MIKKLKIKNFKCYEEMNLDFTAVNILTGLNGMGKSTIMQSILLLGQSKKSIIVDNMLSLDGEYLNLGVGQDILYEKAEKDEVDFQINIDDTLIDLAFEYQAEMNALPMKNALEKEQQYVLKEWMERLFYLSAYRIEPRFLYRIGNENTLEGRHFGNDGELAIQYLKLFGEEKVENDVLLSMSDNKPTINDQVRWWLDMISPGVSPVVNMNLSSRTAELQYEYIEGRDKTNSYKSINVGFGITYVLPVIVTLVAAKPGDIILIENPEAHIHPRGQRVLGELIASVGSGGVQVIVETHSDHVLNGIRVSVKKGKLAAEKAGIYYFYKNMNESYEHQVQKIVLDKNGRLDEWPNGFFDEWDNALLELL